MAICHPLKKWKGSGEIIRVNIFNYIYIHITYIYIYIHITYIYIYIYILHIYIYILHHITYIYILHHITYIYIYTYYIYIYIYVYILYVYIYIHINIHSNGWVSTATFDCRRVHVCQIPLQDSSDADWWLGLLWPSRPGSLGVEFFGFWGFLEMGVSPVVGHIHEDYWLVVWLPFFIFPYIGLLIIPIDSYFSEGWPNHQPD